MACELARRLGYRCVSTGDMYRAFTLKVVRMGLDRNDRDAIAREALRTVIDVEQAGDYPRVRLDGEDVTSYLRDPAVDADVSPISKIPEVRRALGARQRAIALEGGVVMEGRDIGTIIVPEADRKFFLTAGLEERARRRVMQLQKAGQHVDYEQVRDDMAERDRRDIQNDIAPLQPAPDSLVVSTDNKDVDQVVRELMSML